MKKFKSFIKQSSLLSLFLFLSIDFCFSQDTLMRKNFNEISFLNQKDKFTFNAFLNISNEFRFTTLNNNINTNYYLPSISPFFSSLNYTSETSWKELSIPIRIFIQESFSKQTIYFNGVLPQNANLLHKLYNSVNKFSISPRYDKHQISFGTISPYISDLTFNGMSFFGARINLDFGLMRLDGFYGINQIGVDEYRYFTDGKEYIVPGAFERKIWGLTLGIGEKWGSNFDISFLKIIDDTMKSRPNLFVSPQEGINLLVKSKTKVNTNISFNIELAGSLYTNDIRQPNFDIKEENNDTTNLIVKEFNTWYYGQSTFIKNVFKSVDHLLKFGIKSSTKFDFSGLFSFDLKYRNFSLKIISKYIGPGYEPIGNYSYFAKDYLDIKLVPFLNLVNYKLTIYGNISYRINSFNSYKGIKTNNILGNLHLDYALNSSFRIIGSLFQFNILSDKIVRRVDINEQKIDYERFIQTFLTNASLNLKYNLRTSKNEIHRFDLLGSYELLNDKSVSGVNGAEPQKFHKIFSQLIYNYIINSRLSVNSFFNLNSIWNYGNFVNTGVGGSASLLDDKLIVSSDFVFNYAKQVIKNPIFSFIIRPNIRYKVFDNTTISLIGSVKFGKDNIFDNSSPQSYWLMKNYFETYINLNISQVF